MKKISKIVCILALSLLAIKGLYGFYEDYFMEILKKSKLQKKK